MTGATAIFLLAAALPAAPNGPVADSACADVYDRVPGCAAIAEEPLVTPGEPLLQGEGSSRPPAELNAVAFSPDAMAWRLIASSGVVAVFGAGLFAASYAYGVYADQINAPPADPLLVTEYVTGWGGVGAMVLAGLLGSAGAIFFVFDPGTGRLRFDLSED